MNLLPKFGTLVILTMSVLHLKYEHPYSKAYWLVRLKHPTFIFSAIQKTMSLFRVCIHVGVRVILKLCFDDEFFSLYIYPHILVTILLLILTPPDAVIVETDIPTSINQPTTFIPYFLIDNMSSCLTDIETIRKCYSLRASYNYKDGFGRSYSLWLMAISEA